jgi:heme-degrading monooxygenase HmoA
MRAAADDIASDFVATRGHGHVQAPPGERGRVSARSEFYTTQRTKTLEESLMFIAMNRFRVKKGSEQDFEQVWLNRDTHLERVPGFIEFHLLKGPENEDHTLYSSHTVWQSRATFEAWTRSEEFRAAHSRAGDNKPLYLEHPHFEGFEVRQTVKRAEPAPA